MHKIIAYDSEAKKILRKFELGECVGAPFSFYFEMHKLQKLNVEKLAEKVDKAERIVLQVLNYSGKPKTDHQESQSLKFRIFEVCRLLFD